MSAATLARDLVNTPANDLGPTGSSAIRDFATANGMKVKVTLGDDLLTANFPLIHAVGRASVEAPRLMDLSWGKLNHPRSRWWARVSPSIPAGSTSSRRPGC